MTDIIALPMQTAITMQTMTSSLSNSLGGSGVIGYSALPEARLSPLLLIRRRQPTHRELNFPVRQLAPMFYDRHVAARRKLSKKLARFGARVFEGERESFAQKAVWIETS
jgi:hypothetical protein